MVPYIQSGERNFAAIYSLFFLFMTIFVFYIFRLIVKSIINYKNI